MNQLPGLRPAYLWAMWRCILSCLNTSDYRKGKHRGESDMLNIIPTSLMLVLTISGCATIIDGTSQPVTFNSEPNRAKVFINGAQVGVTPLTIQVQRSKATIVVAKKEGYEEQQFPLQTKMNGYFWGNFISGGFLGSTIDYASGSMVEYSPNMYFFSLEPIRKSEADGLRLGDERKIRQFILVNHAHLAQDLVQGKGEYLFSLYDLLAIKETPRREIIQRLKLLAAAHRDPPSFAEAVINAFVRG